MGKHERKRHWGLGMRVNCFKQKSEKHTRNSCLCFSVECYWRNSNVCELQVTFILSLGIHFRLLVKLGPSFINWKSNLSKLFIQLDCHIISVSPGLWIYPSHALLLLLWSVFVVVIWYPFRESIFIGTVARCEWRLLQTILLLVLLGPPPPHKIHKGRGV